MSQRSVASVVAFGLLVSAMLFATLVPLPYVIFLPGPTVNLLAKDGNNQVVRVNGTTKVYRDKGALRLLTVIPSGPDDTVNLVEAFAAWVSPDDAVYRKQDIYQQQQTPDVVQQAGAVDMVNSQDSAVASALHELGYKFGTSVQVLGIQRGGPGDGALEVHDRLVSVNGQKVTSIQGVVGQIRKVKPGTKVTLVIVRRQQRQTVRIRTGASATDPKSSAIKITVGRGYEFPIDVNVRINSGIGGPSAGTMFALAIYDTLTPGSLTGGSDVAGTGTIDGAGNVGGIGGIQQKLVAAQNAGAQLFLAPAANCDEVVGGPYDPAKMRVVKIQTLHGAIAALNTWRSNPQAKLPRC
ncbi:MAG: PDZ domain-containing protein [Actinomycetota bacterium]|nr:PDZ domain-containing protein [Actinomycetota bacterium]